MAPPSRSSAASWGDARRPLSAPTTRSRPFDPAAAWRNCLFAYFHYLPCRCGCSQGFRAETERASRTFVHEMVA